MAAGNNYLLNAGVHGVGNMLGKIHQKIIPWTKNHPKDTESKTINKKDMTHHNNATLAISPQIRVIKRKRVQDGIKKTKKSSPKKKTPPKVAKKTEKLPDIF